MLTDYLNAALESARYEKIADEERYYGEIPGLQGLWATGTTVEQCRRSLAEALDDWLLSSLQRGGEIDLLARVLRQAGVSREEWDRTG